MISSKRSTRLMESVLDGFLGRRRRFGLTSSWSIRLLANSATFHKALLRVRQRILQFHRESPGDRGVHETSWTTPQVSFLNLERLSCKTPMRSSLFLRQSWFTSDAIFSTR